MTTRPKEATASAPAPTAPADKAAVEAADAAGRPHRLFAHHRAAAAQAARRRPHGGLGRSSTSRSGTPTQPMPRTVLTPPAGGSPMPDVPNWAWHEYGNRVGFWRFVKVFDEFAIPGVICDQRLGDCRLSADRARRGRAQLGVHRPRLHPAQHAEGAGRARRHPQGPRGDHQGNRQAAARLARARPHRDLGNARSPGRGRLRLRRRLGARRSAGLAQDPRQADPQRALHPGMQRRRHDADPASQGVGILRARARPVRADLRGRRRFGAHHGAGRFTPTSWARRTASNISAASSRSSAKSPTCCSGPAARSSTGTCAPDPKAP